MTMYMDMHRRMSTCIYFVLCVHPQAVNNRSGSPIGALLTAVNTIADALAPEFPSAPSGPALAAP